MPWKESTPVSQRRDFCLLASCEGANIAALCRRFGISRKTGYKWMGRYRQGPEMLADRSRRPRRSPHVTDDALIARILELRDRHPAWGGRKLKRRLEDLGITEVPHASTVSRILKRCGRIDAHESRARKAFTRFEAAAPNDLWQMDFKGHFPTRDRRCHPLGVLDDCSRFSLCLRACDNERTQTVQASLTDSFRLYGMPWRMLMDNGSPWGNTWDNPWTPLTVWLTRLGIAVSHGRPYHPQTQGKEERFHRTLNVEAIPHCRGRSLAECQNQFDRWREIYNHERPHEALDLDTPARRYRSSERSFPECLPEIEYEADDAVRKVQQGGVFWYGNHEYKIGRAFLGQLIALRPTDRDGIYDVFFCHQCLAQIDVRQHTVRRQMCYPCL